MITFYIDKDLKEYGLNPIRGGIYPPCFNVSGRTGISGFVFKDIKEYPTFLRGVLEGYAHEKRFGIVEPGVLAQGCVVPDVLITKEDLEKLRKEWL